jgi:SAM-dependent methyltransferase
MTVDVVDLRDFYHRPLGQMVRRVLRAKLRARWDDVTGLRLLGVGFATPFLGVFGEEPERTMAFMPAAQGVLEWSTERGPAAALTEEDCWPLPDAAVDRILIAHGVEGADTPTDLLRECWRCLAPGGRLMAVVPNRRGPWTRMDTTPFGHGRPYSRSQLTNLLRDAQFTPLGWTEALFFPPIERGIVLRSALGAERIGATLWGPFAGVHVVEATKQVYRPVAARRAVRLKARPVPALAPGIAPSPIKRDRNHDPR